MEPNCVLFIPVSSPSGIGEYMRSMIIAKALTVRWPNVKIHFILNDQVSYLNECHYTVHTCKGSPTKNTSRVNDIIESINPDLVIFDASGRAKQFKQAKAVGAKVAFISQHNKKRSRGLKLNRLLYTDIHWVVQPDYCIKELSYWQRAKLAFFNKNSPKNIGPVFELSNNAYQIKLLEQYNLINQDAVNKDFFVFNAGSGGHKVKDQLAADIYYQAAQTFQLKTKIKCIILFGSNYPNELPKNKDVTCIKSMDNKDFIILLSNAKGCVISAGDTLLQSIALHKPCVAAAVSPDQPARLKLCQNEYLVLAAEPNHENLVQQALLIEDKDKCKIMINNMKHQATVKALETIVEDIALLFSSVDENNTDAADVFK